MIDYEGLNKLRTQGAKHLKRANWKKLKVLIMDCNNIRDEGCQWISKTDFPELISLDLGKNAFIKVLTKSTIKESSI